jgi:hypothetical protein
MVSLMMKRKTTLCFLFPNFAATLPVTLLMRYQNFWLPQEWCRASS